MKQCPLSGIAFSGRCGATTCMWNLGSLGCSKGLEVSNITIARGRNTTPEKVRASKERGRLAIARILILDEYAAFVEREGYPTFLPMSETEKLCHEVLDRDRYKAGVWNISKLVACCSKRMWKNYLATLDEPEHSDDETASLAEQLSAHNQSLRRVMDLSKIEFTSLSFGDM